eukprot:TRINITY_DN1267_c0_g1_i2.p1 TRINITY_DN1267_c0_g1~~TRINITY_DN1267_c0_g1_i2.p1  ORF type:complete len:469 (-),score=66.22 TRINITY_DN1267_c0_g1_i2:193-1599(-)
MARGQDSNQLRHRAQGAEADASQASSNGVAKKARVVTVKDLQGTEVAIDGLVYDISDFQHPGGESIKLLGGNDVTVHYKMIHPYHGPKHREKMRQVGVLKDWHSDYKFDTEFEREMKREVFKIVRPGNEFGTPGYFFRTGCYISLMAYLQYCWSTSQSLTALAAIALGVSKALIGLNVQHDANHGAASKRPWVNDMLGFGADFIGGAKWLWWQQHWTHHSYTNHCDKDPDSFSAEPLMIFNDYPLGHPARTFYQKFQAIYFFFVLSFYWVSSVFNPQVLDLRQRGAQHVGMSMDNDFTVRRRKYAVALRLLYIFLNIVCPIYNNGLNFSTIKLILLMGASVSLSLSVLFSLSHNFENSERDPTKTFRETGEPVCWFKSQVETSSTYGGMISGMLTGGLNFQVEHHLFPRMSSAWYPYIAPTVRKVCEKHGVRYAYYPWFLQNVASTFKYMHGVGMGSSWLANPLSGNA